MFFLSFRPFAPGQGLSVRFEQISIEDGLPNPSVIDVLQDRQGFLWFGMVNGIVRYDGYEMEVFYPDAVGQDSLPERDAPHLYEDKSGNIWLGLSTQRAKLFRYDPDEGRFIPYLFHADKQEQPIHNPVISILEDKLGRLLVGTIDGGLYVIDIQKEKEGIAPEALPFKNFRHIPGQASSLSNNALLSDMVEDGAGNLWISTEDGLNKFIPGEDRFEVFRYPNENAPGSNWISALYFDPPHTLWVSDRFNGLLKFDIEKKEFVQKYTHPTTSPFRPGHHWIQQILKAKDGKLWLAVTQPNSYKFIEVFDPQSDRFTTITDYFGTPYGLCPLVTKMTLDHSGNIWLGSWQHGVFKYNAGKGAFHFLRPAFFQENVPGELEAKLPCEDSKGNLWIGTNKAGLLRWDRSGNTFERYRHEPGNPNSLHSNEIRNIARAPNGYLWIATAAGVERFDPESGVFRHFSPLPGLPSVMSTRSGEAWASFLTVGVCRLADPDEGSFRCFSAEEGALAGHPGLGQVWILEEDSLGNLYFGLNQWGFLRFDPRTETFEHFLPGYGVHDIHFDRYGNTWLATHSGGLKIFDWKNRRLVHLPEEEHARIGIARGILEDDQGYLWMKTPTGIVQFDPRVRRVIRHFSASNWMNADESWYGGSVRAVRISTGEMFYNSPSGLLYFHPDSLHLDPVSPKLALTELRLLNEKVKPGPDSPLKTHISQVREITLSYWQNNITLAFAAMHYKSPQENQYQYRLINQDLTWQDAGGQRTATYTNLDPGNYTFLLKAANSDGVWSDEQALLFITIRPPWYWNAWSITAYVLLLGGLTLLFYRFQLNRRLAASEARRVLEMGQFQSRFYTNITHEFRTPLTLILGAAEQLHEKAGKELQNSQKLIIRQGRQLLRLINQMLSLSKLESNSLPLQEVQADIIPFIKGVAASFESAATRKGMQLKVHSSTDSLIMDFDPEKIQAVLANLLSNALKFTPEGGSIKCEVGKRKSESGSHQAANISDFRLRTSDLLQVSVSDTGIGIPEEQLPYVFDRFYQAPSQSPPRGDRGGLDLEGAGIGLSLVKELLELMNGQIEVKSRPGEGSEFTILLPIRREAARQEAPVAPAATPEVAEETQTENTPLFPGPESMERPLALVVEDNRDMRAFIRSLLEGAYRVQMAPDGEAGILKALELVPDIIVSDVMMPQKDGFELCRTLKQDERTSHIPIILLTAKAGQEHRIEGLDYGADAYLEKPFDRKELEVRLKQLIALRKTLQQRFSRMPFAPVEEAAGHFRETTFLRKLQQIILEKGNEAGFGIAALCQEVSMSRTQLHNKLKFLTGKPASRFIRSVRLQEGRKLLLTTSLSISEIAFQVGFNDANFFSTCFKEEFGEAPSRFRKRG